MVSDAAKPRVEALYTASTAIPATPLRRLPARNSPTIRWSVGAVGLLGAVAAGASIFTSHHFVYAVPYALVVVACTLGPLCVGLYYWRHWPESPVGDLLIIYAFLNAIIGLQGSSQPVVSWLGVWAEAVAAGMIVLLLVVYRRRRLDRAGKVVLAAWVVLVLADYIPWLFFTPTIAGATPIAIPCPAACVPNPFVIPHAEAAFATILPVFDPAWRIAAFVLLLSVFVLYLPLLRRSSPERRAMAVVLGVFSVWLLGSTLYGVLQLSGRASELGLWCLYLGRALFPVAFLAGIVQARAHTGDVLRTVLTNLESAPADSQSTVLARALEDPGLKLVLWLPDSEEFVDVHGHRVSPPSPGSRRVLTELRRHGKRIGGILSDPALAQHPDLLDAAGGAVAMAIENRRLQLELLRWREALGQSERERDEAAQAERRRIEQNLHDSAQQQLLAMSMRLAVIRGLSHNELMRDRLTALSGDLELAMQELRGIVKGDQPRALLDQGLGPAIAEAAARAPIPVSVDFNGIGRFTPSVEEAAYFFCMEALQNAEKHAGSGVDVRMVLRETNETLGILVRDSGIGFTPGQYSGSGLNNMRERIMALGGRMTIESAIGEGTTVTAELPLR